MHWDFEVWGEEFRGRPRPGAARRSYVTVHIGSANDASGDDAPRSTPWPAAWVAALSDSAE